MTTGRSHRQPLRSNCRFSQKLRLREMTNKSKHEFVFLTRTNITSERPTVDTHKMMAMVTSARSGKRKKETTKSWGACCRNRVGGAETAAWEALLEMNNIGFKSKARSRTRNVASCGVGDCFRQRPTRSCFCSGPSPFGSRKGFCVCYTWVGPFLSNVS